MMEQLKHMGFGTQTIHAGAQKNTFGALQTPIYQSSTFVFENAAQGGARFAGKDPGFIYTRLGNPTNRMVEEKVAFLEGAGAALSAGSGMGAIAAALWTALKAGDHVVAADTLYGGTFDLLAHGMTRYGVQVDFVDMTDLEQVRAAIKDNTRVVYVETPVNPTLKITDIEDVSAIAHEQPGRLVMVDNTFSSPYLQQPLKLGADVVLHSATKYINGHGDVVAGFVCGSRKFIHEVADFGMKTATGSVLSPHDAFLIARGLKTLEIRMERHCASAQKVAEFLEGHEAVEKVYYPGLTSFPQYELARKQMKLPGGMISFEVRGGREAGAIVMDHVGLCTLAVSLGDAETLIEHAASMTHSAYSSEELKAAGISEGLVRLSVGLENPEDIIADLNQALNRTLQ